MDNLSIPSTLASGMASPQPQPPASRPAPPPQLSAEFPTPTLPGGLQKFEPFPRLLVELQQKIFKHALEPHSIAPRTVRVTYRMATNSHNYAFLIPPLLKTCQVSRQVAKEYYPSLILNLPLPVYFNTAVDFLYCTSTHNRSGDVYDQDLLSILSVLNSSSLLGEIRFLALDRSLWSRSLTASTGEPSAEGQIQELQYFTNLEELFLVVPTLAESLFHREQVIMRDIHDPVKQLSMLKRSRTSAVANDRRLRPSIVPGFRRSGFQTLNIDIILKEEIDRNFGQRHLPYFGKSGRGWKNDSYQDKDASGNARRVLRLSRIRPFNGTVLFIYYD